MASKGSGFQFQNYTIGTKLILFSVPFIAAVMLVAAWITYERASISLHEKLIQRARSLHTQIMADRAYYASVIVPRVVELGGSLGSDYRQVHGRFPLPATFVREVSELTGAIKDSYTANLISPWPINKDKGINDPFEQQAFDYLKAHSIGEFFQTDMIENQAVLRILMADHASARSCVDCHNAHPQSPRHDFKLHDLMGGLEIVIPMDQYIHESRRDLIITVIGGAGVCLLLIGIVAWGARQTVTQPLAELADRMKSLAGTEEGVLPKGVGHPHGDEAQHLGDVFERMRAVITRQQTQLLEASSRLERQVVALEAANQELEAFSYSVSHDLRAPLRHIDGFTELLLKRAPAGLDETSLDLLRTVKESANEMGTLIDDLLRFAKIGRAEMLFTTVSLDQLAQEVVQELTQDTKGRRIRWTIGPLPEVRGDRSMLRQVLINLVDNAIKYTRHRDEAQIEIGTVTDKQENQGEIVIFVRDNGDGFDMQYAHKLFGVFQRLHSEAEFEGTGVGLASVRRIILRHGGRTWAEGSVGVGAMFYISLPAA